MSPHKNKVLNDFFGLQGKVAMVTGAAGQLGREMVNCLVACGARVLACDMSEEGLSAAFKAEHWNKKFVAAQPLDIRNRTTVEAAFAFGREYFGSVDFLVNNAGVSVFEPYLERPEASIDWVMDVNLKGTINCTIAFVKHRISSGGDGAIVNVASHYGLISPDPRIYTDCDRKNSEIYGATKAGVLQMTRYWAVHAAEHNIRCNSIAPGGVRNPLNPQGSGFQENYGFRCPMKRMAETEEIVGAVAFLLSPAASYVNGQNLTIDGGMTCW